MKYLALSTTHITGKDNEVLESLNENGIESFNDFPLSVSQYCYGFYIRLIELSDNPKLYKELIDMNMSLDFIKLIMYARKKGYNLINLDCDEVEIKELAKHCW